MSNKSWGCIPGVWHVRLKNKTMPLPRGTILFQKCTIPRMFPGVSWGCPRGQPPGNPMISALWNRETTRNYKHNIKAIFISISLTLPMWFQIPHQNNYKCQILVPHPPPPRTHPLQGTFNKSNAQGIPVGDVEVLINLIGT